MNGLKASNQGFIDLHTPFGFFLVGIAFLVLTIIILVGALYMKSLAVQDREVRKRLRDELSARAQRPNDLTT